MTVKTCVNSAPDALAWLRSDTSNSSSPVGEYSTRNNYLISLSTGPRPSCEGRRFILLRESLRTVPFPREGLRPSDLGTPTELLYRAFC